MTQESGMDLSIEFASYLLFFKLFFSFYFELVSSQPITKQKLLNLQISFDDRRVLLPSSYWLIQFAHTSIEERQAATCRFLKEFCENPGNVSTNRIKFTREQCMHTLSSKEFCKFNIILKESLQNIEQLVDHLLTYTYPTIPF